MTYVDVVTFGIALVGATLGVLNFFIERSRTRVKLRIVPKLCYLGGHDSSGGEIWLAATTTDVEFEKRIKAGSLLSRWAVEVTNLSEFTVGISQVGFGDPTGGSNGEVYRIVAPKISSGGQLPVRLESRQGVLLCAQPNQPLSSQAIAWPIAWVETECGVIKTGTSPRLKTEAARASAITSASGSENR